jgi:hypothetical protein
MHHTPIFLEAADKIQGGRVLNRFVDTTTRERIRGANPGTVTGFPANSARNPVAVPGLRRISGQLSPKRLSTQGGLASGASQVKL